MDRPDLGSLGIQHCANYEMATGRDRWTAQVVNQWVSSTLPRLAELSGGGTLLDVGCGEQPFRRLVEDRGWKYVGMDVVQNSRGSVDRIATLEDAARRHTGDEAEAVLCTEVLEHVLDVDAAFDGLRRLVRLKGVVMITVPFFFPLHMEPFDFRRLTDHGIQELAERHGFDVVSTERLGDVTDLLSTFLTDLSILPATRTLYPRLKARILRAAVRRVVAAIGKPFVTHGVVVNSNCYLTNGVLLRAK